VIGSHQKLELMKPTSLYDGYGLGSELFNRIVDGQPLLPAGSPLSSGR
jgi:hypothetical protein